MLQLFAIVMGLVVGSFLNVVINRLKTKEGLNGRSHCPHCKHTLSALDLVPLLSYVFLGGKCRYCGKKISVQYPAVEAFTALTFFLISTQFLDVNLPALFLFVLAAFFIVIGVYDLKHFLILDKVVFPGLAVAVIYAVYQHLLYPCGWGLCSAIISGLLGALTVSGFFYLQYLLSKGKWIGFGDVKYGLLLGMVAGFPLSILLLFMAYMSGAAVGVALILMGKKQMGSKLPFGTFLSFAAIITMLYGTRIFEWYLGLIGI